MNKAKYDTAFEEQQKLLQSGTYDDAIDNLYKLPALIADDRLHDAHANMIVAMTRNYDEWKDEFRDLQGLLRHDDLWIIIGIAVGELAPKIERKPTISKCEQFRRDIAIFREQMQIGLFKETEEDDPMLELQQILTEKCGNVPRRMSQKELREKVASRNVKDVKNDVVTLTINHPGELMFWKDKALKENKTIVTSMLSAIQSVLERHGHEFGLKPDVLSEIKHPVDIAMDKMVGRPSTQAEVVSFTFYLMSLLEYFILFGWNSKLLPDSNPKLRFLKDWKPKKTEYIKKQIKKLRKPIKDRTDRQTKMNEMKSPLQILHDVYTREFSGRRRDILVMVRKDNHKYVAAIHTYPMGTTLKFVGIRKSLDEFLNKTVSDVAHKFISAFLSGWPHMQRYAVLEQPLGIMAIIIDLCGLRYDSTAAELREKKQCIGAHIKPPIEVIRMSESGA